MEHILKAAPESEPTAHHPWLACRCSSIASLFEPYSSASWRAAAAAGSAGRAYSSRGPRSHHPAHGPVYLLTR
jgi:hypothetical protein